MNKAISFVIQKICVALALSLNLHAQNTALNMDFESMSSLTVTGSTDLPGWKINHGLYLGQITTCYQINCCNLPPSGSEVIVAPFNGYIDPFIGPVYPVFSVFGSSVVNTAATNINTHLNCQLKGNRFLRLNKNSSGTGGHQIESLTRTFTITNALNTIDVAYMILTNGAHNCCESPGFRMTISTSSCPIVFNSTCPTNSNSANSFYLVGTNSLSTNPNSIVYSKWQIKRYDLNNFIGQTVTLTINASGCLFDGHFGYAYVDAQAGASMFEVNNKLMPGGTINIPYCSTSVAIKAPAFYATYQWSGPAGFVSTQSVITAVTSGVYTVNLDAGDLCNAATKTIAVNFLPPPTITSFTSAICAGENLVLTASGAASYTWSHNGANTASTIVSPTQTTGYSVLCLDTNQCLSSAFYTVNINSTPTLSTSKLPPICSGDTVKITAFGASTYTWTGSGGFMSYSNTINYPLGNLPQVLSFSVQGALANTCRSMLTLTLQSQAHPSASISVSPSQTICPNTKISLVGEGGKHYLWVGPANYQASGQTVNLHLNNLLQAGTYSLFVTDSFGCMGKSSKQIILYDLPDGTLAGRFSGCAPFSSDFEFVESKQNKSSISMLEWSAGDFVFSLPKFKLDLYTPGQYNLHGKLVDANTCINEIDYKIEVFQKPKSMFSAEPISPIANIDVVDFKDRSIGEEIVDSQWFIYDDKTYENKGIVMSYLFVNEGSYPVAHIVKNKWGCADTVVKPLIIKSDVTIFVPTAFTPGNDDRNDFFRPVTRGIIKLQVQIYDRWGALLFETSELGGGWDGTYRGQPCMEGTYIWKLTATDQNFSKHDKIGHVLLIR